MSDFIDFLLEKNIFLDLLEFSKKTLIKSVVGVSFIIASQTKALSSKIVDAIIFPIVISVLGKDFQKRTTKIGKIEIKTGVLLKTSVEFILIMLFIYYLYYISRPKGILENITETIYGFF